MPIIALLGPPNLILSRRVASAPVARTGPARVHVEQFRPKSRATVRAVTAELPLDGQLTDPLTPIMLAPADAEACRS